MNESQRSHRAYLLRCWRADGGWRYSIERVGEPARRMGFGSLEALMAFLREEAGSGLEERKPEAAAPERS